MTFPESRSKYSRFKQAEAKKTYILLGAPVSASLVSCTASSGCRPSLYPSLALPGRAGIRSLRTDSDSESCPLPGKRQGPWGFRSPLPSSPVLGSRRQTSCLCACPALRCGPVPWTASPPRCSCCPCPYCLWASRSSQPAGIRGGGLHLNILAQL